uniref:demethylepipodophyllotoxin synthase-like n=1 Tax=Erigeron canadensis TaxID=72917 RepID=UPI001CB8A36A|nr:demethylepipodophyllotoxin synthase-like [Erigeron canadensis]
MDTLIVTSVAFISFILLFSYFSSNNKRAGKIRVPEASGSWPIIGHLHLLAGSKVPPHKLFGSMADKFGPIFTIKLGVHRTLIVSNSEVAKECLTTNDRVFSSRPKAMASEVMGHNYANFALAPSGQYWRDIRKLIVLELGSQRRLKMLESIRASEVKSSIKDMYTQWDKNKGSSKYAMIEMKEWFGDLTVNILIRMMFGNGYSRGEQINEDQLRKSIRRLMELMAANVVSDWLPGFRWLDIGGYEKKMKKTAKEMDDVFQAWLEGHKEKIMDSMQQKQGDDPDDQVFMAAFLSRVKELKQDLYGFSHETIVKASCQDILLGATDTTAIILTWALSLLANNPVVFKKAQEELDTHVGKNRNVEESDLKNLVYLQAIIKETMRLYPSVPLLLPHESTEDCVISGYAIPRGTRLLVNAWKIQHDPNVWSDPFEFQPERFLTSKKDVDVKGQHYELIPFGSGRRICVGISFALQAMPLILASILHGFEFQKPSNEEIDMTESIALTNLKDTPLELLVAPRLSPELYHI